MGRKPKGEKPHLPYVPFHKACTSWLLFDGVPYPLAQAPEPVFRSVITPSLPHQEQIVSCLKDAQTDSITRWWLLCALADLGRKVKLYASREEALLAVR